MKKYYLETFGCAMNLADSEKVNLILTQSGFLPTKNWKEADLIILNTCSVRQKGEDRVFGFVEEVFKNNKIPLSLTLSPHGRKGSFPPPWGEGLREGDRTEKKKIIGITGCMVRKTGLDGKYLQDYRRDRRNSKKINLLENSNDIFNNDDKLFPRTNGKLDFVLRIEDLKYLPHILTHIFDETIGQEHKFDDYLKAKQLRENPASATIIIQTGCDNYCSYCIVPYTRGKESSRSIEDIITEAKEAVKNGAKEINLVGQNVNSYGKQFVDKKFWNEEKGNWNAGIGKSPFRQLLEELNKIEGLSRIRFTSSNPHDMTEDILAAHFELPKMCNYLHFALQSGSNEVLKKMNRKHDYESFKKMVEYLRIKDPFFSISTDIIVGFSGETENMFEETLKAFDECLFDFSYNARYSVREGTIASKMYPDDVPEKEKARRWHILNEKLLETLSKRNTMMLAKVEELLVVGEKDGYFYGRTRNFKEVFFKAPPCPSDIPPHGGRALLQENEVKVGDLVKVKIEELDKYVLRGSLVL